MATNNNLGFDPANMGLASPPPAPAPLPTQPDTQQQSSRDQSGLATALDASKLQEQQAKSAAAANNANLAASQAKNAEFEQQAKQQELAAKSQASQNFSATNKGNQAFEAPSLAAQARGYTSETEYQNWMTSLANPVKSTTQLPDATKPYQDAINKSTMDSSAVAQEADRKAMGKARAMGANLDIAQGLGQFASTEALAKGAEVVGTLGGQQAQAQYNQQVQQTQLDAQAKAAHTSELKNQLYNDLTTPEGRLLIMDELRASDPTDPIVRLYDANPEAFATQFSAQDLKLHDAQLKVAVGDMQNKITDVTDMAKVNDYFNSGAYQKIMFPSDTKLTNIVSEWSPSAKEMQAYQKATGKTADPTSLDSLKDMYAYTKFVGDYHSMADSQIVANLSSQITTNGIGLDSAQLQNIKDFAPLLNKTMQGQKVNVSDAAGNSYLVNWSTDTKNGALAPLFTKWDGTSYGDGEEPSTFDKNMDSLFYKTNDNLVKQGQKPLTMSQFGGLMAQKNYAEGNTDFVNIMDNAKLNVLSQSMAKQYTDANIENLGKIKVGSVDEAKNAVSPASFSGVGPELMKMILADPMARDNMMKIGFHLADSTLDTFAGNTSIDQFKAKGIKPGDSIVGKDGKIYKITVFNNMKDRDNFTGTPKAFRILGIDPITGKEVEIYRRTEQGFDSNSWGQVHREDPNNPGEWIETEAYD